MLWMKKYSAVVSRQLSAFIRRNPTKLRPSVTFVYYKWTVYCRNAFLRLSETDIIYMTLMDAAASSLGLRVRIPAGSCKCCVLSGRCLCVGLITRPEESYRVWWVSECDRETSITRRLWSTGGCCAMRGKHWMINMGRKQRRNCRTYTGSTIRQYYWTLCPVLKGPSGEWFSGRLLNSYETGHHLFFKSPS
jgi:hypothetical protein